MRTSLILTMMLLGAGLTASAQLGPAQVISTGPATAGSKRILAADLTGDGRDEVIVAQAFNVDRLCWYQMQGNAWTRMVIDSTMNDPVWVTAGDFNRDGWKDLAAITQVSGEIFVWQNNGGTFAAPVRADSGIGLANALEAADFDGDGFSDLVAIGQHSIDFYRNTGSGGFVKTPILTTATSPRSLECLSLEVADMNQDGHPDVVTGETIGGVIYSNDGSGVFTPRIFTRQTLISPLVHVFDANRDSLPDVAIQHTSGAVNLYLGQGGDSLAFASTLFTAPPPAIRSLRSADLNGDGFPDLFTAFGQKVRSFLNNGDHTFAPESIVYQDASVFVNEVALGDLDGDGVQEYLWSGVNHTLAYHTNTLLSGVSPAIHPEVRLFPNPAGDRVEVACALAEPFRVEVISGYGTAVLTAEGSGTVPLDLTGLSAGFYLVCVRGQAGNLLGTEKVRVQ